MRFVLDLASVRENIAMKSMNLMYIWPIMTQFGSEGASRPVYVGAYANET